MNIGRSIKIALLNAERDQKWLAGKLGVNPSTISQMAGKLFCNGPRLAELAAAFEMTVSEFIALGETTITTE